jgi:hypothetical protein
MRVLFWLKGSGNEEVRRNLKGSNIYISYGQAVHAEL